MNDPFLQFLSLTKRTGKLIEGYNKCIEKLEKSKVFLCILSEDVSQNTIDKFIRLCEKKEVKVLQCYNGFELGKTLGRDEINVLCITDKNMSSKLMEIYISNENNRG